MSSLADVRSSLIEASAAGLGRLSRSYYATPEDGLMAILKIVSAMVLPSCVKLDFDGGGTLGMKAAHGRLLAIDGVGDATRKALGQADLNGALEAMLRACSAPGAFHATATVGLPEGAADTGGLAPADIARAAGLTFPSSFMAGASTWITGFLSESGSDVDCALEIDGDAVRLLAGAGSRVEPISQWAKGLFDELQGAEMPLAAELETAGVMVFADPDPSERRMCVIGDLGLIYVISASAEDCSTLLQRWQARNHG